MKGAEVRENRFCVCAFFGGVIGQDFLDVTQKVFSNLKDPGFFCQILKHPGRFGSQNLGCTG
jgi:hypothetical protein